MKNVNLENCILINCQIKLLFWNFVYIIDNTSKKDYLKITMPDIIETNPKVLSGQPIIKGTRIPVARVLALIGMGYTITKLKRELPDLKDVTKKDIAEILTYHQIRLTT